MISMVIAWWGELRSVSKPFWLMIVEDYAPQYFGDCDDRIEESLSTNQYYLISKVIHGNLWWFSWADIHGDSWSWDKTRYSWDELGVNVLEVGQMKQSHFTLWWWNTPIDLYDINYHKWDNHIQIEFFLLVMKHSTIFQFIDDCPIETFTGHCPLSRLITAG